ncbi:MAG: hypothetical protein ACNA70_01585 [Brevefilum sp.]
MTLTFEPDQQALLALIGEMSDQADQAFLVGGAVRDALLGRPLHDMDFVMAANPTHLAKRLAKRLEAGFFLLDDERHTARVVYHDPDGRFFPLDFVQFTGQDLGEDLRNRDFTVNAMALSLDDLIQVIDPLGGQDDLQRGVLRACSDHALLDDPVRVLRGVRLAVQFGFDYGQSLEAAMREAAGQLHRTSGERQRDEFFRLLAGPDPAAGLDQLWQVRVFDLLIPPLVDLEKIPAVPDGQHSMLAHAIRTVDAFHLLLEVLTAAVLPEHDAPWPLYQVQAELGEFTNHSAAYFSEELTPGRGKAALAYFGALLHEVGSPLPNLAGQGQPKPADQATVGAELAYDVAKRMPLSNTESGWVETFVRHHQDLLKLVQAGVTPDRRRIYRFFKSAGDAGVAIGVYTLADILATEAESLKPDVWESALIIVRMIFSAWWEAHAGIVSPVPLLDGRELQAEFGLAPGVLIGELLMQLVEEQAAGIIVTKDQARSFVNDQLSGR